MDDIQYLRLLQTGLTKHRFYLPQFFKREQKKAEKEFITKDEFANRVWDLITVLDFCAKKQVPENILPEIDRIKETLSSVETNQLILDCELLKESAIEAFDYEIIGKPIEFNLKNWISEKQENKKTEQKLYTPKDLEKKWFKVGLLFITGEITELKRQFNSNYTQIAKHKFKDNWASYRPYITESINRRHISDKNIFSDDSKIEKIVQYCKHQNIEISLKTYK